jgi:hypothetical protein
LGRSINGLTLIPRIVVLVVVEVAVTVVTGVVVTEAAVLIKD